MTSATSVKHDTFELSGRTPLFAQSWTPTAEVRGTIGVVHGLGEHSSRYGSFAERFAQAGFRVVAYDQQGHGRTAGKRGDAPSYEALLDDVEALIDRMDGEETSVPKYLFGQSFGGGLVLNFALRRQASLDGVIASSPLLLPSESPPGWKRFAARLLALAYPSFQFRTGVQAEDLTHDETVVAAYQADPLVHDLVSARFAVAMIDAGAWALEHAADLSVPALLMHGLADAITSAAATIKFSRRAGNACTLHTFADLYHELHWEPEREAVFKTAFDWLNC